MTKIKNNKKKNVNITDLLDLMNKMVYISQGNADNITLLIGAFEGIKRLLSVLCEYVKKVHPGGEISHIKVDEYCALYMKKADKGLSNKESLRMLLSELMDILSDLD